MSPEQIQRISDFLAAYEELKNLNWRVFHSKTREKELIRNSAAADEIKFAKFSTDRLDAEVIATKNEISESFGIDTLSIMGLGEGLKRLLTTDAN